MIGITDEGKQAYLNRDDIVVQLRFENGLSLNNDDFLSGTFELEQSLCEEDQLVYGSIGSACLSVQIVKNLQSYKGLKFSAYIKASGTYEIPLGTFTVVEDELSDDRRIRSLKAYDDVYMNYNKDVGQWYHDLKFPMTLFEFRNKLFKHIGINQEQVSLVNDGMIVQRTIDPDETALTFKMCIQAICEINGALGCITQYNNFRYVTPDIFNDALYPSDDLYPSEDLYPKDYFNLGLFPNNNLFPSDEIYPRDPSIPATVSVFGENSIIKQGSYVYKDYIVRPVEKVVIKESEEDYGTIYGEGTNTYKIIGNFLCYGNENLEDVAYRVYNIISRVSYTPTKFTSIGMPWMELGDYIKIIGSSGASVFPILHRTLSGIVAITDTIEAKGTEYCETQLDGTNASIQQLKSRTLKLITSVKEVSSDLEYYEQQTDGKFLEQESLIKQLPHTITLSVDGSLDKSTNASLTISLYDENGNLIDSADGEIRLSGNVIFASNLRDGTTVISGDNIKTGTLNAIDINGCNIRSSIKIQTDKFSVSAGGQIYCQGGIVSDNSISSSGTISASKGLNCYGNGGEGFYCANNANVGSLTVRGTTQNTYIEGSGMVDNNWFVRGYVGPPSDKRLKKNIKSIAKDYASNLLDKLNPVFFKFKDDEKGRMRVGLIAQEVQQSCDDSTPYVCESNMDIEGMPENFLAVDYNSFVPLLIKGYQELKEEINELKTEIKELKGE